MKNSAASSDDLIGDIRRKQIFESWSEGKSPKQIAAEFPLPIHEIYKILKDMQKQFIQRKLQ